MCRQLEKTRDASPCWTHVEQDATTLQQQIAHMRAAFAQLPRQAWRQFWNCLPAAEREPFHRFLATIRLVRGSYGVRPSDVLAQSRHQRPLTPRDRDVCWKRAMITIGTVISSR